MKPKGASKDYIATPKQVLFFEEDSSEINGVEAGEGYLVS
jgi:hypothetical protein